MKKHEELLEFFSHFLQVSGGFIEVKTSDFLKLVFRSLKEEFNDKKNRKKPEPS